MTSSTLNTEITTLANIYGVFYCVPDTVLSTSMCITSFNYHNIIMYVKHLMPGAEKVLNMKLSPLLIIYYCLDHHPQFPDEEIETQRCKMGCPCFLIAKRSQTWCV